MLILTLEAPDLQLGMADVFRADVAVSARISRMIQQDSLTIVLTRPLLGKMEPQ